MIQGFSRHNFSFPPRSCCFWGVIFFRGLGVVCTYFHPLRKVRSAVKKTLCCFMSGSHHSKHPDVWVGNEFPLRSCEDFSIGNPTNFPTWFIFFTIKNCQGSFPTTRSAVSDPPYISTYPDPKSTALFHHFRSSLHLQTIRRVLLIQSHDIISSEPQSKGNSTSGSEKGAGPLDGCFYCCFAFGLRKSPYTFSLHFGYNQVVKKRMTFKSVNKKLVRQIDKYITTKHGNPLVILVPLILKDFII